MSNSRSVSSLRVRKLTYSALFLALALVLPFLTGQVPQIGQQLCPMHIPVLLCGFLCGWPWGLAVGFLAPLLRFLCFGMPPIYPTGLAMAFELAAYGAFSGLLRAKLPRTLPMLYVTLLSSMVLGRLVWGLARFAMLGFSTTSFPLSAFLAGAVTGSVPGIILQIVIIPVIVAVLEKQNLSLNRR